jgi:hypothetical protein
MEADIFSVQSLNIVESFWNEIVLIDFFKRDSSSIELRARLVIDIFFGLCKFKRENCHSWFEHGGKVQLKLIVCYCEEVISENFQSAPIILNRHILYNIFVTILYYIYHILLYYTTLYYFILHYNVLYPTIK